MPITYARTPDDSDDGSDELPDAATLDPKEFDLLVRPLALATEAELFAELEMRYKSFIFHGAAHKQHDDATQCFNKTHGDYFTCYGLAAAMPKILADTI